MDMKGNIDKLMQEAQKMQEKMQEAQKEIANLEVEGTAGGGMVTIRMSGRYDAKSVKINPSLVDEDIEVIEDLVAAAINDAVRKVESTSKDRIGKLTAGIQLPPGFPGGIGDDK